MRLLVDGGAPIAGGILGVGGEIKWIRPTRPGDILQVHTEVTDITASRSRPDRGTVTLTSETRNQHGEPIQIFVARILVPRRSEWTGNCRVKPPDPPDLLDAADAPDPPDPPGPSQLHDRASRVRRIDAKARRRHLLEAAMDGGL